MLKEPEKPAEGEVVEGAEGTEGAAAAGAEGAGATLASGTTSKEGDAAKKR